MRLLLLAMVLAIFFSPVVAVMRMPIRLVSAPMGKKTTGVTLVNTESVQFHGDISVGTPPQTFSCLFDTGSHETWLPKPVCDAANRCTAGFNLQASTSLVDAPVPEPIIIRYAKGEARGRIVRDIATLGALTSPLPIRIGYISTLIDFPTESSFVGLVGFGPNSTIIHSLMDLAISADAGESRTMSFYLSDKDSPNAGMVTIGGYDPSHTIDANLTWHACTPAYTSWLLNWWTVTGASVKYGEATIASSIDVIIDSGTSFIIGSAAAVDRIFKMAGADVNGNVPCNKVMSLPTMTITINGVVYTLKPEHYALKLSTFHCNVAIGSDDSIGSGDPWILGDTFMLNYLSVFTFEDPAITLTTRPATLPQFRTLSDTLKVRHWVGFGAVNPPRKNNFPSDNFYNSIQFAYAVMVGLAFLLLSGICFCCRKACQSVRGGQAHVVGRMPPGQGHRLGGGAAPGGMLYPMQGFPAAQIMHGYPLAQNMQEFPPARNMQGYPPPQNPQGHPLSYAR